MTDEVEAQPFDEQLAALEAFVAALQAGELETGEAMRQYRDHWRPAIAALEADLAQFRQELGPELGLSSTNQDKT